MGLNIVRVVQDFPSAEKIYGHFVSFFQISVHQRKLGHEVLVICPGRDNVIEDVEGIKVFRIKVKKPLSSFSFQLSVSKILRKYLSEKSNVIIHSHGRTALLLAFSKNCPPHVVHLHGLPYAAFKNLREVSPPTLRSLCYCLGVHRLYKVALNKADAVVSYSKDLIPMLDVYNVAKEKIFIVYNGVDEIFLRKPIDRSSALQMINMDNRSDIVLFVGRLRWIKGVYHLIGAMPKIVQQHPSVKLILIGSADEANIKAVMRIASTLRIKRHIVMLGHVPHHLMPLYYAASQIHVATTIAPGYPKTLLESLACGTPVIASKNIDNERIVSNSHCGLLVNPIDSAEIASKVNYLLSYPDVRKEMGSKERKLIGMNFTWQKCVNDLDAVYQKIMKNT